MLRQVSEIGFGLILSPGSGGGASGMPRLLTKPAMAVARQPALIHTVPFSIPASSPPHSVPMRMATKVPASISALPPTSSSVCRCCGRMAYFTGPNKVEWQPIKNSPKSRTLRLCSQKPRPAMSMMTTSRTLTSRASVALSYLSASCPAEAENRKNGRMKMPAARLARTTGSSVVHWVA